MGFPVNVWNQWQAEITSKSSVWLKKKSDCGIYLNAIKEVANFTFNAIKAFGLRIYFESRFICQKCCYYLRTFASAAVTSEALSDCTFEKLKASLILSSPIMSRRFIVRNITLYLVTALSFVGHILFASLCSQWEIEEKKKLLQHTQLSGSFVSVIS